MKISIFSFAVNHFFPIDIQYRQFKKYIKEDFEFILFNDAIDKKMEDNINLITSFNNIKCVRVPQQIHKVNNPSEGYAATLNWAVKEFAVKNNLEIIVLVHTDVIPIDDICISNIIENNIIASTIEARTINDRVLFYFYPALTIINMKYNIDDLDFGLSPGLDTGGKTHLFIEKNTTGVKFIPNHQIDSMLHTLEKHRLYEYFKLNVDICKKHILGAGWIAENFYHFIAGSRWNSSDLLSIEGHKQRMDLFLRYFY